MGCVWLLKKTVLLSTGFRFWSSLLLHCPAIQASKLTLLRRRDGLSHGVRGAGSPRKSCDRATRRGGVAQTTDLVVLGREAAEGLGPEVGELIELFGGLGESFSQGADLVLEPGDLGVAPVGANASVLQVTKALFEFNA